MRPPTVGRPLGPRERVLGYRRGPGLLVRILLSALAVFAASQILPGVSVSSFGAALTAAVVLALVNSILRPILLLLTLPITMRSLGLFTFVVIGFCVLLVARIVPGFEVDGMLSALAFAFVFWLINGFFASMAR